MSVDSSQNGETLVESDIPEANRAVFRGTRQQHRVHWRGAQLVDVVPMTAEALK